MGASEFRKFRFPMVGGRNALLALALSLGNLVACESSHSRSPVPYAVAADLVVADASA
jgi:hypothetical protein